MSWLPKGYEIPQSTSQFMKLNKGVNRFRILGQPVVGYEWWVENSEGRKPQRVRTFEEAVKQGTDPIKHFWAIPVWNYEANSVQVLQLTQKTIMRSIETLSADEDWGSPENYDLVITRTGDGMDTEYSVQPKPASKIDAKISEAYKASKIDLEALFSGEYPMQREKTENETSQKLTDAMVDDVTDDIPF